MKMTLEIPEVTLRQAKAAARALGIPWREFVRQAVEEKLAKVGPLQAKPWLECAGELRHLRDETRRIQRLINQEFSVIEQ
jgi:hypothetical protein